MNHQDLPGRWKARVRELALAQSGGKYETLGARAFSNQQVRIVLGDGSRVLFNHAFCLEDAGAAEVAVFTEHSGYHLFPSTDSFIEVIDRTSASTSATPDDPAAGTLPIEEKLSEVVVDLLTLRELVPFPHRVFSVPAGTWQRVLDCCVDLAKLPRYGAEVFAEHGDRFMVTHLAWPGLMTDDPGRMVLFVHDDLYWSKVAFFNTGAL